MYGMERTTVYLTRELRVALKETSQRRRVSEATLIREGIALVTADAGSPRPVLPLIESGIPDLADRADESLDGFGE